MFDRVFFNLICNLTEFIDSIFFFFWLNWGETLSYKFLVFWIFPKIIKEVQFYVEVLDTLFCEFPFFFLFFKNYNEALILVTNLFNFVWQISGSSKFSKIFNEKNSSSDSKFVWIETFFFSGNLFETLLCKFLGVLNFIQNITETQFLI